MAHETRTGDELIDEAEQVEADRGAAREERAANLFDIRRISGGLFLLYGIVLVVLGFGASDADLRRASGVNVNLSVGVALLVVACLFIAWALLRPLGRELEEAEAETDAEHEAPAEQPRFTREEQATPRAARPAQRR